MSTEISYLQANVNAGEISPKLAARPDTEKYKTGAKVLENFIVLPYGSIHRRPGTEYVGQTKSSTPARLEGFRRSATENYILEFTEELLRIWTTGSTRSLLKVEIGVTPDLEEYTWASWLTATNYTLGDKIYIPSTKKYIVCTATHTSDAAKEPELGADWSDYWTYFTYQKDDLVYEYDLVDLVYKIYRCVIEHDEYPTSGIDNTTYWMQMTPEDNVGATAAIEIETPYQEEELFDIQFCQINDVMFLAHPNHHPKRLSRYSELDWRFENVPFEFPPTLDGVFASPIQAQFDYENWDNGQTVWAALTPYVVGEYVKKTTGTLGIYRCILAHTSSAAGAGGNEPGVGATWATYWTQVTFAVGDRTINSNGLLYTCHTAHTPKNSTTDALGQPGITSGSWTTYWNEGTSSEKLKSWIAGTNYVTGNKILFGKVVYEVKLSHKAVAAVKGRYGYQGGNNPGFGQNWTLYWKISSGLTDLTGVKYKLVSSQGVFTSEDEGIMYQISIGCPDYYESVVISTGTNIGPSEPIFIQGAFIVSTNWLSGGAMVGTLILEKSDDGITWYTVRQWITTDVDEGNISYSSEADAVGSWYRVSAIRTSGGTSGRLFKIEPVSAVLTLPFRVEEYVSDSELKGRFILPNDQIPPANIMGVSTSNYRRPAFGPTSGYPRTVTYHQSRVWWGGLDSEPSRIWGSKTEDLYVFLKGTTDTDGLDFMLSSTATNKIMWLRSYNKALVVGTEGEIYTVDAGTRDSVITASNVNVERRVNYGCSTIPATLTGDSLLFFQRGKKRLREFAYSFERDAFNAPDMTMIAEQMNQDSFIQAAFQSNIEPVLWCVTEKGGLVGFSYDRDQNITAWHRHITGERDKYYNDEADKDMFTSVAVVFGGENQVDEIWFTVKRYIDVAGTPTAQYYVERFSPEMMNFIYGSSWRAISYNNYWRFLDSYQPLEVRSTLTSPTRTRYSSLVYATNHLLGRDVESIRYGGVPLTAFDFGTGTITLTGNDGNTSGFFNPVFGLPYTSLYIPTKFEVQLQNGTSFGKKVRIDSAVFSLWRSYGGQFKTIEGAFNDAEYAQDNFELGLMENKPYTDINYQNFIFSPSTDYPRNPDYPLSSTAGYPGDFEISYTGQTQYNVINSSWSQDLNFIVSHSDPNPFNLRGIVFKLEVQ